MNPSEVLRIVDAIHRDKNIDKEIVFEGIEAALVSAAKKHFGEEQDIVVTISREDGSIAGTHNGVPLDPYRNGRADWSSDGQAGDDPEDPRGGKGCPL
jgi:N utilization substance protein A